MSIWYTAGHNVKPGMNNLDSSPEKCTLITHINSAYMVGGGGKSWTPHGHLVRVTRLTNFKNQAHGH